MYEKDTFSIGREGEMDIQDYFRRHGCRVEDLSDDPEYRAKDIDMRVIPPSGRPYTVEVKTDRRAHETGNIIIEYEMDRMQGQKSGWWYFCEADVLCFYIEQTRQALFLSWPIVKRMCIESKGRPCTFKNPIDINSVGRGRLLSIEKDLRKEHAILWESYIQPRAHAT